MQRLGPSTLQICRLDLKARLETFLTLTSPGIQNNALMTSYICILWKHDFSKLDVHRAVHRDIFL